MHPFQDVEVPWGKVGIQWFGQSSFSLKNAEGTLVQIDPYFPHERPPDRFIHAEPPLNEADLETDYVLLTHDHGDHTCVESLLRIHAAYPDARYIGPPESVARLADSGIPFTLLSDITAGESAQLGTMTAHAVWSKPMVGAPEEGIPPPNVQHLGYVVDTGAVRVYVTGDPIHTLAEHDRLVQAIAALKPDIGLLTTHPDEGEFPFFAGSIELALKLGLEAAVPSHYQCFVKRNYDPQAWAAMFPEHGPRPVVIPYNGWTLYPE